MSTIDAAIATLRASWPNDGAEGESVHLVCAEVERLTRERDEADGLISDYATAVDDARAASEDWRNHVASQEKWRRVRETERALREAGERLRGHARHSRTNESDLRAENEQLRGQMSKLRREITTMRIAAEKRNRDLDTLHMVWCDGGCVGGAHRYCGKPEDVTEEIVALAERHVSRLRTWFRNYQGRTHGWHALPARDDRTALQSENDRLARELAEASAEIDSLTAMVDRLTNARDVPLAAALIAIADSEEARAGKGAAWMCLVDAARVVGEAAGLRGVVEAARAFRHCECDTCVEHHGVARCERYKAVDAALTAHDRAKGAGK